MSNKNIAWQQLPLVLMGAILLGSQSIAAQAEEWTTVVNNGDVMPNSTQKFNSYSQPALSNNGLIVFRGRSKGGSGGGAPTHGIYKRNMGSSTSAVTKVVATRDQVPAPNNTNARFNEFPSAPRIDAVSSLIATRGQSQPVWQYTPLGSSTSTKVGTAGIFITSNSTLKTAVNQLGNVPQYASILRVPDAPAGTKFDQFPGSASPTDSQTVVFKGNYSETVAGVLVGKTGVYFRNASSLTSNPIANPVKVIANSNRLIPGNSVPFGSTAPPSAANSYMVFAGFDNEDAPTLGGLYKAPLSQLPALKTLVKIGSPVPNRSGKTFTRFGESLSFDGRYVAFWGAWDTGTGTTSSTGGAGWKSVTLTCSTDGEANVVAACLVQYPSGTATFYVPINQGVFVLDTNAAAGTTPVMVASTDSFDTFVYWGFSGSPGTGGGDSGSEPPRWRSTSFIAVTSDDGTFEVAFKGIKANSLVDGVYLANGAHPTTLSPVIDTTTPGPLVDREAPIGTVVSAVGLERDGFRNEHLAITASMLNADATVSWGGVYVTKLDD
jgi:hypothetical protein